MTAAGIVDECYNMRADIVGKIRARSTGQQDDFGRLAHYISRLGATRSSVNAVVKGTIRVPALGQISTIRVVDAPGILEVPLHQDVISPYEIVREICQNSPTQNPLDISTVLHNIVELDLNPSLRKDLASEKSITTRVHAELQIADQFSRYRTMEFVDGDKYIGCSKPACYFCYNWLDNQKA